MQAFVKGLDATDHEISNWQDADIVIIPSASVITKQLFREMKEAGKRLVLRVDNALRDSRNRGDGMNRLREFAEGSSAVVYQSEWARGFLSPVLKKDGTIIYNGIDTSIFCRSGVATDFGGKPTYLWTCASKGETKRWEWAWYRYQQLQRENPDAVLVVAGILPSEITQYNLDFFNGEKFKYLGYIEDKVEMAAVMRGCDYFLATYENDCYSQTYCEALCCGCELFEPSMTGGTPELIRNWNKHGVRFFSSKRMVDEYIKLFEDVRK